MLKSNALIFGLEGIDISKNENAFFRDSNPLGFILFSRNIQNPEQVSALVQKLKDIVGWNCPILIDQEGGRVARLRPPHWRDSPPMSLFAQMAKDNIVKAEKAAYLNARIIGKELTDIGINVDCAPVCDLLFEGAHSIVGDRSFGSDVDVVSKLACKTAEGLIDSGVIPVIKHIPGHGRAMCDSHVELPVVEEEQEDLSSVDFQVFKNLNKMPWAMTAHILYNKIDPEKPATLSKKVIDIIRNDIEFDGFLISDDLSMEALNGSFASRTKESIKAGCDAVLHCNGKMDEMIEIASNVERLNDDATRRLESSIETFSKNKNDLSDEKVLYEELIAS